MDSYLCSSAPETLLESPPNADPPQPKFEEGIKRDCRFPEPLASVSNAVQAAPVAPRNLKLEWPQVTLQTSTTTSTTSSDPSTFTGCITQQALPASFPGSELELNHVFH